MDPTLSSTATAVAAPTSTSGGSGSTATDAQQMAFQYAMSAALNAPNVLGGGGGSSVDDDDNDGSALTVGLAI